MHIYNKIKKNNPGTNKNSLHAFINRKHSLYVFLHAGISGAIPCLFAMWLILYFSFPYFNNETWIPFLIGIMRTIGSSNNMNFHINSTKTTKEFFEAVEHMSAIFSTLSQSSFLFFSLLLFNIPLNQAVLITCCFTPICSYLMFNTFIFRTYIIQGFKIMPDLQLRHMYFSNDLEKIIINPYIFMFTKYSNEGILTLYDIDKKTV